jgi:predicted nuclease with TOPRIM domain
MHNEQCKEKSVTDILDQMAQDSSANSDQIDKLDDSKLDKVSRLANEAARLQEDVDRTEEEAKHFKKALYKVTDELLPAAMEELDIEKLTLNDGSEISVKPIYAASIPKDRRDEAYDWLREHGDGDIIKNNVTITFGKGEDQDAQAFMLMCGNQGFTPQQAEKIEPMTLKAWLREKVEAGDPVPLDLFGAFISQRASIKRGK